MRKHSLLPVIIVTAVLLTGLFLLLYPTVADYVNTLGYKKEIKNYRQEVESLDDSGRLMMLESAEEYNRRLLDKSSAIGALYETMREEYESLLNPSGTGMMGYIEIEKLGIYLPIYHGTKENVLQAGAGHMEGSSLPVGGDGTHAILSGHTGLPSSKLFSNIDQLGKGDTFRLHILGRILTYRVESVNVVLPKEAEKQEIDRTKDLCTLMTCTPYGINTHRLLVTGVRTGAAYDEQTESYAGDDELSTPIPPLILIMAAPVAALLVFFVIYRVRKKHYTKDSKLQPRGRRQP